MSEMSDERLNSIRQRLNSKRLSHPAGKLPAFGDLQALQECVGEIDRQRIVIERLVQRIAEKEFTEGVT